MDVEHQPDEIDVHVEPGEQKLVRGEQNADHQRHADRMF